MNIDELLRRAEELKPGETPETDKERAGNGYCHDMVDTEFAEGLETSRNAHLRWLAVAIVALERIKTNQAVTLPDAIAQAALARIAAELKTHTT